jgi:hypothetical protein
MTAEGVASTLFMFTPAPDKPWGPGIEAAAKSPGRPTVHVPSARRIGNGEGAPEAPVRPRMAWRARGGRGGAGFLDTKSAPAM